ncbi:helix-turn-helix domain-containing protein [Cellulomonas sp. GbtcB1]|uniref:helix-turn-helix domain-containing protein n=1 Tax=Cellulomonas sp. GbtcB1 TaxID=2824746 RepID=UPI001C306710|nr:helix-turn-helix transcriptional regulator [Cellulomonas sp. GbtcB1]
MPRSPVTPEQLALGTQVRTARKNAGIAQERLAMIAGLDRAYVGEIERGRANPSLKTMWKLARAIGVHPRQFLADDPEDYAARASEFTD